MMNERKGQPRLTNKEERGQQLFAFQVRLSHNSYCLNNEMRSSAAALLSILVTRI